MSLPSQRSSGPRSSMQRVDDAARARDLHPYESKANSFKCHCPIHPERTGSVKVDWKPGPDGGKVLMYCHGCNAPAKDLAEAMGLTQSDLFDEPRRRDIQPPRVGRSSQQRTAGTRRGRLGRLPATLTPTQTWDHKAHVWVEVDTYSYVDADGVVVQAVVREHCTAGGEAHKQFRQRFLTAAGEWVNSKPEGFLPVPYQLPAVLAAIAAGEVVYLVEGEKDVHSAEQAGAVATTNTQGGHSFPAALVDFFRGAHVRVVLDRDDTGYDRGVAVHGVLGGVAASVQLLLPATAEAKTDLTDHLQSGLSLADLIPVTAEEVLTWSRLGAVQRKAAAIEKASAEATAQMEAADGARAEQDLSREKEHTLRARRWAVESEIRFEELRDLHVEAERAAVLAGSRWAGEAAAIADTVLQHATVAARRAHEAAGVPMPAALATEYRPQQPPNATPVTDDRAPGDRGGGTVVQGQWHVPNAEPAGQSARRRGSMIEQPRYRIHDGCIVLVDTVATERLAKQKRSATGEDGDEDQEEVLKLVLGLDVQIAEMEYLEDAAAVDVDVPQLEGRGVREAMTQLNPPAPPELAAVTVTFHHPATGEALRMRIPADDYRTGVWLESLPGPPAYDSKPSGMARLRDAIKAVSGQIRSTVRYRWTGWRQDTDGQWMYVHAAGAIAPDGAQPVPVLLGGTLSRYDLPDPVQDAAVLRQAFLCHSGAMLHSLPGRVAAPLLGHVYRAALGPNPWVLVLQGIPGSYKTSIASLAMHHYGELWDRRRPASSLSGNGDTTNAMRIKMNAAKDTLIWFDDVAPTKDWTAAQKMLEEVARMVHNGEQRSRSTRDGLTAVEGTPPRTSAIITSEVMPRPGSGAERMLLVPLQKDEIDEAAVIALDAMTSRHGRALVMASMLQWLAGDLQAYRVRFFDEAARYSRLLKDEGASTRKADSIAECWAGWVCMLTFLETVGALTSVESVHVRAQVNAKLRMALQMTENPDLPGTTGARARELLAHALNSGLFFVEDVATGQAPSWPLGAQLGWRRTPMGADALGEDRYRVEARGGRVGYVRTDAADGVEIWLNPAAMDQMLKAAAAQMQDGIQLDRTTALQALCDDGTLIPELVKDMRPRHTVQRVVSCENRRRDRFAVLRMDRLFGEDGDTGDDTHPDPQTDPDGPATDLFTPPRPRTAATVDSSTPAAATPDVVDSSRQTSLGSTHPDAGLTSPTDRKEKQMGSSWPDADGVVATLSMGPAVLCLGTCGQTAGAYFLGLPMHVPCWMASTAASREAALAARQHAAAAAGPDPAPPASPVAPPRTAVPAAAATPSHRPSAGGAFRAAAAVLDVDGIWLPDGHVPLPERLHHVGQLAELVDQLNLGTQVTQWRSEPGQIWVTAKALTNIFGVDASAVDTTVGKRVASLRDLTRGSAMVADAITDRWQLGNDGDCLGAWTRVWRGDKRGVWIALIPGMSDDPLDMPVLGDEPDAATLARRLHRFEKALRAPWTLSGSTTGFNLAFDLRYKDRDRLFQAYEPIPPARDATLEAELNWSRTPMTEEAGSRYVHAYDRGGSHAAGIASLEVGIGAPTHHPNGCEFTKALPGYWRVEVPEIADWRAPHPLKARGKVTSLPARPVWVTTPTLTLAQEWGYEPQILEAWTWSEHGRVFEPWYERIRDARTALDVDDVDSQLARDLLKVTYTRTIGMLGSEQHMAGRLGYAPDRRHHIVAKARANILRRIALIGRDSGRWPVAAYADTIFYVSDDPDPVTAWPGKPAQLGRGFGQYKAEASGLLADQLPFLTGDGYRGKQGMTKSGDARPGAE